VAATENGGGASPGEGMAPWWTSEVAGEDGDDELSGWSGSDKDQGVGPSVGHTHTHTHRERESGVQLTDGVEAELWAAAA
jgi:hypothetical protein